MHVLTVCYGHPSDDVPNFADGGVTMFVAHD